MASVIETVARSSAQYSFLLSYEYLLYVQGQLGRRVGEAFEDRITTSASKCGWTEWLDLSSFGFEEERRR
jgi:hypothetical protein